ncbi:hypothetical protein PV325_000422 [Microctonus aethiopoides]|nr:hypothetical protein PV325_000422 [Microctonus aethiopoides]
MLDPNTKIILINLNFERFPSNFDQFPTAPGTKFNFTRSKKYAKLFCIEEMLLKLKQMYNPLNPQRDLLRIGQEFRSLNDKIEEYYRSSARSARSFSNLKYMIGILCTRINDLPTMDDLDSFMAETYDGMIDEIILYDDMASEAISDAISDAFRSLPSEDRSIVPGTLWCGAGNSATSDHQLGFFSKEDKCCRQHDKCSFNIGAGKKFGRLINKGLFTKSACFCDREFYECLKDANSIIANKIGYTYFTVLSPQCIGYDHPITGCKPSGRLSYLYNKCFEPTVDYSKPKQLQWFNNPDFK